MFLALLLAGVVMAETELTPSTEFVNLANGRAGEIQQIVGPKGQCSDSDPSCITDKVITRGIKTSVDVVLGSGLVMSAHFKALRNKKPCDETCITGLTIRAFDMVLRIYESINLNDLYAATLLKPNDPNGELIRATEEFILFRHGRSSGLLLAETVQGFKPGTVKDQSLRNLAEGFKARIEKLTSAALFKDSFLAKLPQESAAYQALAKAKDPAKQKELDLLLSEFHRLTGPAGLPKPI